MSAPDRDPWRQRARHDSDPGAANIWALDDVPASYRGVHAADETATTAATSTTTTTTASTDAPRGHQDATTSDGPLDASWLGHARSGLKPQHRPTRGDPLPDGNNDSARRDDSDESSKTDILLPSTPSSCSSMVFSCLPSRLVDASALPPAGLFDKDYDYQSQSAPLSPPHLPHDHERHPLAFHRHQHRDYQDHPGRRPTSTFDDREHRHYYQQQPADDTRGDHRRDRPADYPIGGRDNGGNRQPKRDSDNLGLGDDGTRRPPAHRDRRSHHAGSANGAGGAGNDGHYRQGRTAARESKETNDLMPTNGLGPVDHRWLRDPVVAAAEFVRPPSQSAPRSLRALPTRRSPTHGQPQPPAAAASVKHQRRRQRDRSLGSSAPLPPVVVVKTTEVLPMRSTAPQYLDARDAAHPPPSTVSMPLAERLPDATPDRAPPSIHQQAPLFNADGFVVPLARRKRTWQLPVCIAGQAVWVAVSTTRRTLTVSTHDLRQARLRVPAADLVCSLPSKRTQLYCSDVVIPVEDPSGDGDGATAAIRARRFDFYVGRGRFTSRIGLLGGPDRRSLFAHLRLPIDLFALRFDHPQPSLWRHDPLTAAPLRQSDHTRHDARSRESLIDRERRAPSRGRRREVSWMALGAAAEPPEGAVSCALVPAPGDEKGIIALAAAGIRVGRVRFDFLEPLPAIVHAEVPGLCVPHELYVAIAEQIASMSGLFRGGASVERGRRALIRAVARLPSISVVLHRDPNRPAGGGRVRLDVPPWAYTLWHRPRVLRGSHGDGAKDDGGRLQLLISPLEAPERNDHQCMVLGAACLARCVAAFSLERGRAWFWSDADDSDLPSTSDDDDQGQGCRP